MFQVFEKVKIKISKYRWDPPHPNSGWNIISKMPRQLIRCIPLVKSSFFSAPILFSPKIKKKKGKQTLITKKFSVLRLQSRNHRIDPSISRRCLRWYMCDDRLGFFNGQSAKAFAWFLSPPSFYGFQRCPSFAEAEFLGLRTEIEHERDDRLRFPPSPENYFKTWAAVARVSIAAAEKRLGARKSKSPTTQS